MTGQTPDPLPTSTPRSETAAPKGIWHPPTFEEVDYSETEASGVGGVYDFVVYSGSV